MEKGAQVCIFFELPQELHFLHICIQKARKIIKFLFYLLKLRKLLLQTTKFRTILRMRQKYLQQRHNSVLRYPESEKKHYLSVLFQMWMSVLSCLHPVTTSAPTTLAHLTAHAEQVFNLKLVEPGAQVRITEILSFIPCVLNNCLISQWEL